jgi:hypothetical protein
VQNGRSGYLARPNKFVRSGLVARATNHADTYHNRDLIDSEWMNLSQTLGISSKYYYIAFLFGLYTILSTDMISSDYIMMALNYRASNSFLLPQYRTSWAVEIFTK